MKKLLITLLTLFCTIFPLGVLAQLTIDDDLSTTFGLGEADLTETIINITQWVLGVLGLIAVIMIIYAVIVGATTSDADRAASARKALISAIVGLVIILLAWAIVTFVVDTTSNVST